MLLSHKHDNNNYDFLIECDHHLRKTGERRLKFHHAGQGRRGIVQDGSAVAKNNLGSNLCLCLRALSQLTNGYAKLPKIICRKCSSATFRPFTSTTSRNCSTAGLRRSCS